MRVRNRDNLVFNGTDTRAQQVLLARIAGVVANFYPLANPEQAHIGNYQTGHNICNSSRTLRIGKAIFIIEAGFVLTIRALVFLCICKPGIAHHCQKYGAEKAAAHYIAWPVHARVNP